MTTLHFPAFIMSVRRLIGMQLLSVLCHFFTTVFRGGTSIAVLFLFRHHVSLASFTRGIEVQGIRSQTPYTFLTPKTHHFLRLK